MAQNSQYVKQVISISTSLFYGSMPHTNSEGTDQMIGITPRAISEAIFSKCIILHAIKQCIANIEHIPKTNTSYDYELWVYIITNVIEEMGPT